MCDISESHIYCYMSYYLICMHTYGHVSHFICGKTPYGHVDKDKKHDFLCWWPLKCTIKCWIQRFWILPVEKWQVKVMKVGLLGKVW